MSDKTDNYKRKQIFLTKLEVEFDCKAAKRAILVVFPQLLY